MQQDYSYTDFANPAADSVPARQGQRLANYLIDTAIFYLGFIFLGVAVALAGQAAALEHINSLVSMLASVCFSFTYYVVLEAATGRTVGKLFTRTRVVMEDGSELTTRAVIIRSLCRIIPLEIFSFLGGAESGWHDVLSKTKVVKVTR